MALTGYTKLFASILASTVWGEADRTRIVWFTLMAMCDKNGRVEGSVPGIASFARVPIDDCRAALEIFEAPDPDSRTPDHEGRRIAKIPGGWQLLNHQVYRDKMSKDERRIYMAQKQREWREREKKKAKVGGRKGRKTSVNNSKQKYTMSTHTDTDPDTDLDLKEQDLVEARSRKERVIVPPAEFSAAWSAYPRKVGKGAALKAWDKYKPTLSAVLDAIAWQKDTRQWKRDRGQFVPHMSTWLNQTRWLDEPEETQGGNDDVFKKVDEFFDKKKKA